MRGDLIVLGLFLLIIGAALASYTHLEIQEYQEYLKEGSVDSRCLIGDVVETLKNLFMFGVILSCVGLFIALAGVLTNPQERAKFKH